MSRCYPYPPPGYQKKAQPELITPAVKAVQKEKHKSKDKEKEKKKDGEKDKEKKDEKKDKDKKDREKKEKDRDKDKEKKDKEKNKDKDKDKERRDKDKRDKDKDKEKESKKRKKDVEANGTSHGDKDPRSSKLQRTDLLHSTEENGRGREIKTTAAVVVARPLDRDGKDAAKALDRDGKDAAKALDKDGKDAAKPSDRDGKDAAKPRGSVGGSATRPSSVYSKEQHQPNGKVDRTLPPIVLSKPVTGGIQAGVNAVEAVSSKPAVKVEDVASSKPAVKVEDVASSKPAVKVEQGASSSRPSNHNHHIDSNNSGSHRPPKLPDFSVCDAMPQRTSWSAVDDEDWLSSSSERVPQKPKAEVGEDTAQQVWADAIFLPSVDMYALPYVVPY